MHFTNSIPRGVFSALKLATLALASKRAVVVLVVSLAASTVWAADDDPRPKRPGADFQKKLLGEVDADKNGKLDKTELAKARQTMAKRRRGSGAQGVDRRELVKRFDKDGDGRLNEEERQAAMKASRSASTAGKRPDGNTAGRPRDRREIMKRFDKNGDGKLDETERAALRAAFANRRSDSPGRPNASRPDGTPPARTSRPAGDFMKRFDKDGDGKLDDAERAAARAAIGARRNASDAAPSATKPDKGRVSKIKLLKEFDSDGDGKLTGDERAAARKAFEKRKPNAAKK